MIKISELSNKVDWLEKKIMEKNTEKDSNEVLEANNLDSNYSETKQKENVADESDNNQIISVTSSRKWLTEDWLLKLGAILLLLSFSWFVRYAFVNNWISEIGRIYLGIGFGAILLLYGWNQLYKQAFSQRGTVFSILGSAFVILSMFAAREFYNLFAPEAALFIMFLSVLAISLLGIFYKNKLLYIIGFVVSAILPFMLNISYISDIPLFSYLLMISLGAILLDEVTKKPLMSILALVAYVFYSIPYIFGFFDFTVEGIIPFVYIFTVVFLILSIFHSFKDNYFKESYGILLYVSAFTFLAWVISIGGFFEKTFLLFGMLAYFVAGLFIYYKHHNKNLFFLYLGPFIASLAVFTFINYEGSQLLIAYILEISIFAFAFFAIFKDLSKVRILSSLFVVPIVLSFKELTSYSWYYKIIQQSFFTLLILALALAFVGILFSLEKKDFSKNKQEFSLNKAYAQIGMILSSFYFYALIWLSLHTRSLGLGENATVISLVIYIVIGLIVYFYGSFYQKNNYNLYGKIMLLLVILRLLTVDVWSMDFVPRMTTFFVIGVLFIATTFIGKKKKHIYLN